MEFKQLHIDTHCDCVKGADENLYEVFARRVRYNPIFDKDFKSKWEKKQPYTNNSCKSICSHKGISVNLFDDSTKEDIINKYIKTFTFSPGHKAYCCTFKFRQNAGKLKRTESQDKSHFDFFKCDSFTLDNLEILEYIDLNDHV
ncbi:MAG: hypothetical protein HQK92_15220 [Nitrospirae bacterium]|nr:hypothetical protein [Nitrospirota bacterium]